MATFFFVGDYDGIIAFFKKLLTPKQVALVEKGQSYVKNVLFIYIRSYSFLFLLTFTELCIGMFLLKMPYPALLALCIAVFDILPVLGTAVCFFPGRQFFFIMKEHGTGSGDTDSVSGDPCCEKYGRAKNCRKADRAASSGNTGSAFPGTEAFWSGGAGCLSGSPDCTCEFQQGRTDGKIIKYIQEEI